MSATSTFTEAEHPRAGDGQFTAKHLAEGAGTDLLGDTPAAPTAAELAADGTIDDRAAETLTADGQVVVEFSERSYAPSKIVTERPNPVDGFTDRAQYTTEWGGRVRRIRTWTEHEDTGTAFGPDGFDRRGFDADHRHRDTGTYWAPQRPDGTAVTCDVEVAPGLTMRGERGPSGDESWSGSYRTEFHGDDVELNLVDVDFGESEEGEPNDIDTPYVSLRAEGDNQPIGFDIEVDLDEGTPRDEVFERVVDDIEEQIDDGMRRAHEEGLAEARAGGFPTFRSAY